MFRRVGKGKSGEETHTVMDNPFLCPKSLAELARQQVEVLDSLLMPPPTSVQVPKARSKRHKKRPKISEIEKRRLHGLDLVHKSIGRPKLKYTNRRIHYDDIDAIDSLLKERRRERENWRKLVCQVLNDMKPDEKPSATRAKMTRTVLIDMKHDEKRSATRAKKAKTVSRKPATTQILKFFNQQ